MVAMMGANQNRLVCIDRPSLTRATLSAPAPCGALLSSTFSLCAVQNYRASIARAAGKVKRAILLRASASLRGCLRTKKRRAILLPARFFGSGTLPAARTRAMA